MAPEWFACMHVRQVNFDEWNIHSRERIAQGDAGMGERRGVEYDELDSVPAGLVNPVDQCPLVVALKRTACKPGGARRGGQPAIDLGQCLATVDLRLTTAK